MFVIIFISTTVDASCNYMLYVCTLRHAQRGIVFLPCPVYWGWNQPVYTSTQALSKMTCLTVYLRKPHDNSPETSSLVINSYGKNDFLSFVFYGKLCCQNYVFVVWTLQHICVNPKNARLFMYISVKYVSCFSIIERKAMFSMLS